MSSIGTYNERTLHASLKKYIEPDTEKHEIPYKGYIADIKNENRITEIQTGSFGKMSGKLKVFLEEDEVTVVYPAVRTKWVVWIDSETGEVTSRRKSPKKGSIYSVLSELYYIRDVLDNPKLKIRIIEVDVEEYKKLDGWSKDRKKGATKVERIPVEMGETIEIRDVDDLIKLIPEELHSIEFSSAQFGKAVKLNGLKQWCALKLLCHVGVLECEDMGSGRAKKYVYKVKEK